VARTFAIDRGYRIEAVTRVRAGKPISSTLRMARLLIAKRGWTPRTAHQQRTGARDPLGVMTVVRVAFGGHPNAALELMDYYALLAPIVSVLGTSFATWERQHDVDSSKVLAMMDDAIAFAVEAEQASAEILAAVNAAFARVN
jgi:hypothetical protein